MQSFVGREVEAITLTHYDGECTEALTDNYLKLRLHARHQSNQRVLAAIHGIQSDGLSGSLRTVL